MPAAKTAHEYCTRFIDALQSNYYGVRAYYKTFDNFYKDFAHGLPDFPKITKQKARLLHLRLLASWNTPPILPFGSITKESALAHARYGAILHYTGKHPCTRTIGPRGGVKESITQVRVSGCVKTWKRSPERFEFPVKYGLYENGIVSNNNASEWHFAHDCPLLKEESPKC